MKIERLSYGGLSNCYRLSNGVIDLITPAEVGLRIVHFGYTGERNEFYRDDPLAIPADRDRWQPYGGHRLWAAPEQEGRTTLPDNQPITLEDKRDSRGDFVRLIQPVEALTRIQKEIDIRMDAGASVEVVHRIRNQGVWDVTLALWAISVMLPGGTAIIPLPPRGSHPRDLLPASRLALWTYTDLSDARFRFGQKYLYVRQDRSAALPQKIGALVPSGWAAYANGDHLFVKQFAYVEGATYPDLGSNVEAFTNPEMLELETLGPLITLTPDGSAEYRERWTLARDVPVIETDADVDQYVVPVVAANANHV